MSKYFTTNPKKMPLISCTTRAKVNSPTTTTAAHYDVTTFKMEFLLPCLCRPILWPPLCLDEDTDSWWYHQVVLAPSLIKGVLQRSVSFDLLHSPYYSVWYGALAFLLPFCFGRCRFFLLSEIISSCRIAPITFACNCQQTSRSLIQINRFPH